VSRYYPAYATHAFLTVLLVSWVGGEVSSVWAERKPPARQGSVPMNRGIAAQPTSRSSDPALKNAGNHPKHVAAKNRAVEGTGRPLPGKAARRAHRHSRRSKPLRPRATVAPTPDLSYHGMLQQPQRYAPQYQRSKGGAPNPNAGTLLHDHFQELDKNRDGSIDPFERAFGRLDMDRDLADRQWQ